MNANKPVTSMLYGVQSPGASLQTTLPTTRRSCAKRSAPPPDAAPDPAAPPPAAAGAARPCRRACAPASSRAGTRGCRRRAGREEGIWPGVHTWARAAGMGNVVRLGDPRASHPSLLSSQMPSRQHPSHPTPQHCIRPQHCNIATGPPGQPAHLQKAAARQPPHFFSARLGRPQPLQAGRGRSQWEASSRPSSSVSGLPSNTRRPWPEP